jgi:GntR family transcriptional repressor for pyruvate dehydrogenase complex
VITADGSASAAEPVGKQALRGSDQVSQPDKARGRERASPREKPQQVADELRQLIVTGDLAEGELLGREPDLISRFGVSRPSLREALRIVEAEGLISVRRGATGGIVVRRPDQRMTARSVALVLQARNVPLADVFQARKLIEPIAARLVAASGTRRQAAAELRRLMGEELEAIDDPVAFDEATSRFHCRLVDLAGNQTLGVLGEMLNEIFIRAVNVAELSEAGDDADEAAAAAARAHGLRAHARLAALIESGDAAGAEQHWAHHMELVGEYLATTAADLMVNPRQHDY